MKRGVARVTPVLAVALLAGATAAQAQIAIRVDDARVVEQSAGPWPLQVFVRLPGPAAQVVTVQWSIVPGSAMPGAANDYTAGAYSGTFTFNVSEDSKLIPIQINGDTVNEWSPTLQQDEVFFVQLSNPSANATLEKPRGTITLLDDDRPMPGLQFLAAVATNGTAAAGQNVVQWRVPGAPLLPTDVLIRWNTGAACTPPGTSVSPLTGGGAGQGRYVANFGYVMGPAGAPQVFVHTPLPLGVPHCYSLFAEYGGTPSAELATVKATPFDATAGPLKWSYSPGCTPPCGAATLAPPSVGFDAVYTVDNAGVVHAMQRGLAGGPWPIAWNPLALGKPTQSRSAVIPMQVAPTLGDWRLFLGTDGGGVHSVDGKDGRLVWSRSAAFGTALPSLGGVQAAPAGLFRSFGGSNDMLLVGTNNASNQFFGLDPQTGSNLTTSYSSGALGNVTGMAVVDYAANRTYFTTTSSSGTLFALDMGVAGSPSLTLSSLPGGNPLSFSSGSNSAAVLRNNRLYFAETNNGKIDAHDIPSGNSYSLGVGDGQAKGFLWPDRRDDRLYFATDTLVHAVRDQGPGPGLTTVWSLPVQTPSIVLQWPGTDYLYIGDGNGRLIQIDVVTQLQTPLLLEGVGVQIGAPSLDGTNNLVIVGSAAGRIHAVRVPY